MPKQNIELELIWKLSNQMYNMNYYEFIIE